MKLSPSRKSPERCVQATLRLRTLAGVIWFASLKWPPPSAAPGSGQPRWGSTALAAEQHKTASAPAQNDRQIEGPSPGGASPLLSP